MEDTLITAGLLGLSLGVVGWPLWRWWRTLRAWRSAAQSLGGRISGRGLTRHWCLRAEQGDEALRIGVSPRSGRFNVMETRFELGWHLPPELRMMRRAGLLGTRAHGEGVVGGLLRRLEDNRVLTGDEGFDAAVEVRGPAAVALAILDDDVREIVAARVYEGASVARGGAFVTVGGVVRNTEKLLWGAEFLSSLTRTLRVTPSPERLLANATETRCTDYAVACLAALVEAHPKWRPLVASLRALLVRYDLANALRAQALRGLDRLNQIPLDTLPELCELDAPLGHVAVAATLDRGGRVDPGRIACLFVEGPEGAALACRAATEYGERFELQLIALVGHPDDALRLAAVVALEKVGGRQALGPLRQLPRGVLANAEMKQAAARTEAAILARVGDTGAGGLTLSPGEGGTLGVSEEAGALSDDPHGS